MSSLFVGGGGGGVSEYGWRIDVRRRERRERGTGWEAKMGKEGGGWNQGKGDRWGWGGGRAVLIQYDALGSTWDYFLKLRETAEYNV